MQGSWKASCLKWPGPPAVPALALEGFFGLQAEDGLLGLLMGLESFGDVQCPAELLTDLWAVHHRAAISGL